MLGLSFLLWTISSSVDFAAPEAHWPVVLDRLRFLPFALALLFFPNGEWGKRGTCVLAAAISCVFLLGLAEASGIVSTSLYLPLAIACVLGAIAFLVMRFRSQEMAVQQQLKWVLFGLVGGIGLILAARAASAFSGPARPGMAEVLATEAMFQLGIVTVALGFLVSLLRYRLYDAEAAISRSAAYAGLTLALVATFAASEAIIQSLGQRLFGPDIGDLSGGIAAAIAAALLTPLHGRISGWAEQYFQRDLAILKQDLPDLLHALSGTVSLQRLAAGVLSKVEQGLQSTRSAIVVDGKLAAVLGMDEPEARDDQFPVRVPLRCPFGTVRGYLLVGPRPDGSVPGGDDLAAIAAISPLLERAILQAADREESERRAGRAARAFKSQLSTLKRRIERLEKAGIPKAVRPGI
jgi:hypothetical protein